jgi:hypothetical protein
MSSSDFSLLAAMINGSRYKNSERAQGIWIGTVYGQLTIRRKEAKLYSKDRAEKSRCSHANNGKSPITKAAVRNSQTIESMFSNQTTTSSKLKSSPRLSSRLRKTYLSTEEPAYPSYQLWGVYQREIFD